VRLFIATKATVPIYYNLQKQFFDSINGKWVSSSNLHLTWKFLGDIEDTQDIIDRLSLVTPLKKQIELEYVSLLGKPPRVLYIGIKEQNIIYQKAEELKSVGFDIDRFKPHITLCRIKHISIPKYQKALEKTPKNLGFLHQQIALYSSTLTPKGAIYKKIFSV